MARYYLNPRVVYKSKETFSCIYHQGTGWYYPAKPDFWRSLKPYKKGKDIEPEILPSSYQELVRNRFLIERKVSGWRDYLDFYPMRIPGTVFYEKDSTVDIAVERKGAHDEIDFDIITLDSASAELWRYCDGTRTLKDIAKAMGSKENDIYCLIEDWLSFENQLTRLLSSSVSEFQEPPPQLIYKAPFLPKKALPEKSVEDVHRYHLEQIEDGQTQFERIESTLSHIYRVPHPILGNKTYGQALYRKISEIMEIEDDMRILEVGGGTGSISKEILSELIRDNKKADYLIYDLSPALIRSQKMLHKKSGLRADHVHGNAELLALRDSTVDIALSNEAVADFYTPEVNAGDVKDLLFDHEIPMTHEFFYFYKDVPGKVRVNLGAFLLLKELYRVLKEGGLAVVTEFGYQDRLPFRAGHLDHAEYSIQFGQLISVATALGFNVYLTDTWDFLGFREDVRLISGFSYMAAFRLLEGQNVYLPNITYTPELLKKELGDLADGFRGIDFVEPSKDPFKIVKVLVAQK